MNMKALVSVAVSIASGSVIAADMTINAATNFNTSVTVDDVYANADVQVGSNFRINSSKYVYLPGANGSSSTFTVNPGGSVGIVNNLPAGGFRIGSYRGFGCLNIGKSILDPMTMGRIEVYDGAVAGESGYVDMKIGTGRKSDGHWNRTYITKAVNGKTRAENPFRILFTGSGGALSLRLVADSTMFVVQNANAKTVLEGDGNDIVLYVGVGGTATLSNTNVTILADASQGSLRTQGDCDLVFHNTTTGLDSYGCKAILSHSTNNFEWAHTGETVISNTCIVRTTADYALPNGPQTGPLHFKALNSTGEPKLDLHGTTQIVNGVRNSIPERTAYGVTDIRSWITNSSEKAACLIVRNVDEEEFCVGHVSDNIRLRKEGAGTLKMSRARFSDNDLEVLEGVVVLTNAFSGVAYEFGAVTVADGARLVVDGCKLDCTSLSTSGSGGVEFRNGGTVSGGDVSSARFVLDSSANSQGAFLFSGLSGTVGSVSVEKTGTEALTIPYYGQPYGDVHVREGLLRPAGQFVDKPYWRYTFTETTARAAVKVHLKNGDDYDEAQTSIVPAFALNRIHHFASSGDKCNTGLGWAGKDAATLAERQCTANMTHYESEGFGSQGGYFSNPGVLSYNRDDASWVQGIGFESESDLSAGNPLAITFRVRNGEQPALGYLFLRCVNYNSARPYSWTVEVSDDGTVWTTVDTRSQMDLLSSTGPQTYPNDGVPLLFGANAGSWLFRPSGTVRVDADAVLDTSDLPDGNVSIRCLSVDMACGTGRITKFVPAANGELRIHNVSGDLPKIVALFDVDEVVDEKNLETWKVYKNDVLEPNCYAVMNNGRLVSRRRGGMMLIFK